MADSKMPKKNRMANISGSESQHGLETPSVPTVSREKFVAIPEKRDLCQCPGHERGTFNEVMYSAHMEPNPTIIRGSTRAAEYRLTKIAMGVPNLVLIRASFILESEGDSQTERNLICTGKY